MSQFKSPQIENFVLLIIINCDSRWSTVGPDFFTMKPKFSRFCHSVNVGLSTRKVAQPKSKSLMCIQTVSFRKHVFSKCYEESMLKVDFAKNLRGLVSRVSRNIFSGQNDWNLLVDSSRFRKNCKNAHRGALMKNISPVGGPISPLELTPPLVPSALNQITLNTIASTSIGRKTHLRNRHFVKQDTWLNVTFGRNGQYWSKNIIRINLSKICLKLVENFIKHLSKTNGSDFK